MKYFERLLLGIVSTVLFAGWIKPASAEISCNIDFAYGLAVNDTLFALWKSLARGCKLTIKLNLGLVGSDHDSYERLNSAMKRVKVRVKDKFRHASNHYFIGPGSLESVDDFVDSEIEAQLEEAISTSVGGILSAISGINTNSDEVNSEKVAEITRQLGTVGEQLERDMNSKATSLRNKAERICNKLKRLDVAEEKLRASIPALQPYNLIISHSPEETE